jgi:hypothetical protein
MGFAVDMGTTGAYLTMSARTKRMIANKEQ